MTEYLFSNSPKFRELIAWAKLFPSLELSGNQWSCVKQSYERLINHLEAGAQLYGTHTHFGAQGLRPVEGDLSEHQLDLLRYLNVGVGPVLSAEVVRRALRIQAQKVAQGYSGVSPQTLKRLVDLSNQEHLPRVPRYGSLGASGDLVPMAHAVAPIFQECRPGPRDVLALVNTNAMMASLAIETYHQLEQLWLEVFDIQAEIWVSIQAPWQPLQLMLKEPICNQHPEQAQVAAQLLARLQSLGAEAATMGFHQSRYSIRCVPQIMGVAWRQMIQAQDWILEEASALSDNPIVLDGAILHGGLFYASGLAAAADLVQDIIGRIGECLDRQILILMDPVLNAGLGFNLEQQGKSHCKGIHQLISSLCQRLRGLSQPCRMMSFSCESNNQDLVPCAMEGWNLAVDQLEILKLIIQAARFCSKRALKIRKGQPVDGIEQWLVECGI